MYKDSKGNTQYETLWSATPVKIYLRNYIEPWEQLNKDVHGHNEKEQAHIARIKHTSGIRH